MRVSDCASVIRSKNAGPLVLTIDVFFADASGFEAAKASPLFAPEGIAGLYRLEPDAVRGIFWSEVSRSVKVSFARWSSANDPFCTDLFGAHLHTPLAESEL